MDVLPDEQERLIQETAREFFAAEATPALVRAAEKDPRRYSPELWGKLCALGWLGVSLPESCGGQGLPLSYAGLLMEEAGRHIAPVPLHSTLTSALALARFDAGRYRELLAQVIAGKVILSFALQGRDGGWRADGRGLASTRAGKGTVLNGERCFVDNFRIADKCLLLYEAKSGPEVALVDTRRAGIECVDLVTTAKDSQALVRFADVLVEPDEVVASGQHAARLARDLCDVAAALMASQLAGTARRDMEFAVEYAKQREAFGQPIGAFQAIQHLAADMLIAVDGAELLVREALWRLGEGLPASVEVSQAKAFASDKCVFVGRSAQQIHGGLGFMMECDLQLWYRRIVAFSLRCGSAREHRQRVAAALLDQPGKVRLGMTLAAAPA
ncbi:MAG: hypothetical protein JWQ13_4419 [Ramlibacter sp.]|nr:hypothetical protein [Ramlibacter sp.]